MKNIKTLDVTLRDGGCVNNFNFGQTYMLQILRALEESEVDVIELGYIDEKKGSIRDRTQYINEKVIYNNFLKNKISKIEYVAMIDYEKYDVNNLEKCHEDGIDGIRVAFHKKDRFNIIEYCKTIIKKGYHVYIQPMTIMRYSDKELIELIEVVNKELQSARAFYIVDSFGEMRMNDMQRLLNLVDHNLIEDMTVGFHSHNNLQLSYSNAVSMLQFPMKRDIIIDCSLVGMGKGAGNLNTELFLEHLNLYYNKNYKLSPLLKVIDNVINQIKEEFHWGYAVEFYLSSTNHCTPSYASYFYNKHMLSIDQVAELLSLIEEEKKISFDEVYAEDLYRNYNEARTFNDENTICELKKILKGNNILLLAPGKSLSTYAEQIKRLICSGNYITITMNMLEIDDADFVLVTRQDVLDRGKTSEKKLIVTSNLKSESTDKIEFIDYKKWVSVIENKTYDSAGIVILNLLEACDVKEIVLAGFDGYKGEINENYYDIVYRRPINSREAEKRNQIFNQVLRDKIKMNIKFKFLTPTLYIREKL